MFGQLPLTKDNLLRLISSYDIFKYYIPSFKEVGQGFRSELRNDSNPTCFIYVRGNELVYKDFASQGNLSCFDYVAQKYNLTYYQSLQVIALDFKLDLSFVKTVNNHSPLKTPIVHNYKISEKDTKLCEISVIIRDFNLYDKEYWNKKYNITVKELKKFKVFPLDCFFINGTFINSNTLTYGYYLGLEELTNRQLWKIYKPLIKNNSKGKWFTNADYRTILGYANLPEYGELLIITKSLKDVIVLNKANLIAISAHAEGIIIQEDTINHLKERFKKIIVIFDNDKVGILNANKYKEKYNLPIYFLPESIKDPSDFVEYYSLEDLIIYLKETVDEISSYYSKLGSLLC
jgi:hypothetical protein